MKHGCVSLATQRKAILLGSKISGSLRTACCRIYRNQKLTSGDSRTVFHLLTKGFSPKATGTKAGTSLAIWTKCCDSEGENRVYWL